MLDRLQDAFLRQRAFVSDASHELRTPLTAIRGQIEVLARSPDPTEREVAEAEARIVKEIQRMDRLVDDLLVLAQTDEGLVQHVETIDPARFIPETVAGIARGSGREVGVGIVPAGSLTCDADRLAQVLRNLVRNAIEHTERDGSVSVSASSAGGSLRVVVDDDGPGIPASQRSAVFDRFHRSDDSRARRSGGSWSGTGDCPRDRRCPWRPDLGGRVAGGRRAPGVRATGLPARLRAGSFALARLEQKRGPRARVRGASGVLEQLALDRPAVDHRVAPSVQGDPLRKELGAHPVRVAGNWVDSQRRLRPAGCHGAHRLSAVSGSRPARHGSPVSWRVRSSAKTRRALRTMRTAPSG